MINAGPKTKKAENVKLDMSIRSEPNPHSKKEIFSNLLLGIEKG